MPIYDESDKAALVALIRKYQRNWYDRDRDKKIKAAAEARLEEYVAQTEKLKAAFALFGVTGFKRENWDQLETDIGSALFGSALEGISYRPAPDWQVVEAEVPPEPTPPATNAEVEGDTKTDAAETGTVRDIVLQQLETAGAKGAKAADIRQYIEKLRGAQLHEKTVGMTLYRLSTDGLARREGRTWFFVPPPDEETKNPGGDSPGQSEWDL